MSARAVILGCAGPTLGAAERLFFRAADPWGFILFARNIDAPEQIRRLVGELREAVGRAAPVLIDQEGGRVARLRPPHWRDWPVLPDELARLAAADRPAAVRARYHAIARDLAALGIDVNCVPMVDVPGPGAHEIITSRVLGQEPAEIAALGAEVCAATRAGGVLPVVKHIPGHGRAAEDSHADLPRVTAPLEVLDATDFLPFRALAGEALAMTAHVIYDAIDPDLPATLSPAGIAAIRGRIGFGGCLMTDDISMGALAGGIEGNIAAALAAGCDLILHCNGEIGEMETVAGATPRLAGAAAGRAAAAIAARDRVAREAALAG